MAEKRIKIDEKDKNNFSRNPNFNLFLKTVAYSPYSLY